MRRGSVILVVFAMVISIFSVVPAGAVTEPTSEATGFEAAEAELVVPNSFKKLGNGVWVVHLADAPVATYEGGTSGLNATSNAATGEDKLDVDSPEAVAYRSYLEGKHDEAISALSSELGRSLNIRYEYFNAANAVALYMTWQEASAAARLPEVANVQKDTKHTLDTDAGPAWIGAPSAWDGSATGLGTKGEGVIVGVLDSGINPSNPSFAAVGPIDGYQHSNPLPSGGYLGACDATNTDQYDPAVMCNDKLIGAWNFVGPTVIDDDGHGSHTASTAAGNEVEASVVGPTITETRTISGVAPHANIIAYDVCDGEGCDGTAILAGIDQAIADGVDVINYSIGSESPGDPWTSPDEDGFLAAREAGIFVAHSAGNEGPGAATVGSPMAPWMTHVAATTHDRAYVNGLINMAGGDTAPPADISGLGFTSGTGLLEIVYAGDYASAETGAPELCGVGSLGDFNSPWDADTFTSDQIVVCDRGTFGRVEKGANVLAAGAGGYVLADNGGGLSGDAHELPAVHITQSDGQVLKDWLASGTGHMAQIAGATLSIADSQADIMAGFSSRGPNRSADILAPTVAAPGVDIIAAYGTGDPAGGQWNFVSGTSMASPHVAGVAALMKNLRPSWTPPMVESALAMTGIRDVLKEDGATPADPFDFGGGRVDVAAAANAGLVLDEVAANYIAANPAAGGDPADINMALMSKRDCVVECTWTRTFTATVGGTWSLTASGEGGMAVSVSPASFSLSAGGTQAVTITANVESAAANQYHFGSVEITGSGSDLHMPLAVQPTTGSIPEIVRITTARDAGSWDVDGLEALEITDLRVDIAGLAKADITDDTLVEDSTPSDPYDNLDEVNVTLVDAPAGSISLHADVTQSEAPDLDMYVGLDVNGDGLPSADEQICQSASGTALESCTVQDPDGSYWILIQNWASPPTGQVHAYSLATAVVPDADLGNMDVIGPDSVPQLDPFSISVLWDLEDAAAGDRYYGEFALGTSASKPGNIGTVPVRLNRVADDVTKTASADSAVPGDTVDYTITVNPNVTNQDLAYTISDTIPEGMTYVEGSVTGGATVTDGVVEWSGVMESPALAEMYYETSTPATNQFCDTGFGGYVDLEGFGIFAQSGIVGDTQLFSALSGQNPIHFYGDYYSGVSFSDDGFIVFDGANNYGGEPWVPQQTPDAAAPNNLLTMLWNDFEFFYDGPTNTGVSIATAGPDLSIIEWDNVQYYNGEGGDRVLDMEVVLFSTPDPVFPEIVVAYNDVNQTQIDFGLTDFGPFSIGVENAAGDAGLNVVFGDPTAVLNEGIVCYDWVGPEFDPVVITYQVTVDADAPHGIATNAAVSITDNAGDMEAVASVDVAIVNLGSIGGAPYDALNTIAAEIGNLLANVEDTDSKRDVQKLVKAQSWVNKSLRDRYWVDAEHLSWKGGSAFWYMQRAADSLMDVRSSASFDTEAEALAKSIAATAATLTYTQIEESTAHRWLLQRAKYYAARGDSKAEAGDYDRAIGYYRYAWTLARSWSHGGGGWR